MEICLAQRIDIKIASVSEGKDPCDFLLSNGKEQFDELAEKFVSITDILAEISSKSSTQWNDGILRLYERWLKTRSKRDERLLCAKGILPNRTVPHKVIQ